MNIRRQLILDKHLNDVDYNNGHELNEAIISAMEEYAKQFKKLNLHGVSGSAKSNTVNTTKKKFNLWRKITKELALLDDNNYKARIIYDYVVKHYR